MTKLDDFNKMIRGGHEISKVYHLNQEIWNDSGLIAGDMEAGFYGEVPTSDFITGDGLCSLAGITAGTSQYSNEPWLKFSYLGETVFVSKKPIRYNISWSNINSAGCVFGGKTVTIKGQRYKVTLLKGKTEGKQNDTSANSGSILHNSMWNRLMGQVHENAPSNWSVPGNMESTLVNWGINYTDADLVMHRNYGNGSYSWCQEYGDSTSVRQFRGVSGVSGSSSVDYTRAHNYYGFRPALILVP